MSASDRQALLLRLGLTALVVLGASPGAAGVTASGVRGIAVKGPTTPVCRAGVPCSAPAKRATIELVRSGAVAGRAVTDDAGRFRIPARPGRYALRVRAAPFGWAPRTVVVPAGRYAVVRISIDTGIR